MIKMSFTLEMDRPIIRDKHYISPGGYSLRFSGLNGLKEVQFDFNDYEGTIRNEKYLDCIVWGLDTVSFRNSTELVSLLRNRSYDWGEFFVYTGESEDAVINPIKAFNICIEVGTVAYKMKDYVFSEAKTYLSAELFGVIKSVMARAVKFCSTRQMMVKGGGLRFFENGGNIFLCTKVGNGYCYDLSDGSISTTGFIGSRESLTVVKGIIRDILTNLTEQVHIPVKSIFIPTGQIKGAYYKESVAEPGSYDIVFE